jgi:hypothetical protein
LGGLAAEVVVGNIGGDDSDERDQGIRAGGTGFEIAKEPATVGAETDVGVLDEIVDRGEGGEPPSARDPEHGQSNWLLEAADEFGPCRRFTGIDTEQGKLFRGNRAHIH